MIFALFKLILTLPLWLWLSNWKMQKSLAVKFIVIDDAVVVELSICLSPSVPQWHLFFGRRYRGPVWSPSIIVISPTIQRTLSLSLSLNIKTGKKPVKYSVVDAFADSAFKGNPAAVCLLEEDKDDEWLQSVAAEFNLAATCYLTRIAEPEPEVRDSVLNPRFRLRWFNPLAEVKLCGHGSLAASHFLFNSGLFQSNNIEFLTLSGVLTAKRVPETKQADFLNSENGEAQRYFSIELDFPATPLTEFDSAEIPWISKALNGASMIDMKKTTTDRDLLVVLPSGKTVADLQPQFDEIIRWPGRGVIVTGIAPPGSGFDFFSRFFCPKYGINEDPACGSAHCALANYWSKKLGKCDFVAYQASPRGAILNLHLDEKSQRVLLRGKAITVMEGCLLV